MKAAFICPIFETYPQIISSLICQTRPDWELWLIHNGPSPTGRIVEHVTECRDARVRLILNGTETGHYGHPLRRWAIEQMRQGNLSPAATHVVITNGDNYYVPSFVEKMLQAFEARPSSIAAYCSQMVHHYESRQQTAILENDQPTADLRWSQYRWGVLQCRLQRGYIDCGGVMIRKDAACSVDWSSLEHSSDWTYFEDLIAKYGEARWVKVDGCLFVHN